MRKDEKQILKIIKYTPPIVILVVSIAITFLISMDYKKTLDNEKKAITIKFIHDKKQDIKQLVQVANNYIGTKLDNSKEQLKEELKKEVSYAKTIANSIYLNNKDTKTKDEIIKLIKDALREIRFFDKRGYIFIHNMQGINILHPFLPKREGMDISKKTDKKGINRFQIVHDIVKEKSSGFATFHFYYPEKPQKQKNKIVYVEHFAPYDWMIGTGEYLSDFEENIKNSLQKELSNKKDIFDNFTIMDKNGKVLVHKNKTLQNKNIFETRQLASFIPMYKDLETIKEKQNLYLEYKNITNQKTKNKTTNFYYVTYLKQFQWIISTNFFADNVEEIIKFNEKRLEQKYNNYYNTIIISAIIVTMILLYISFNVAKILELKFIRYKNRLENEIDTKTKQQEILQKAQAVAKIGHWELDLNTMKATWSNSVYDILEIENNLSAGPELLKELAIKEDWLIFENSLSKCLQTGEEHNCEYRIKTPNNKIKWLFCKGLVNKDSNKLEGIIQDITESKKLEQEKKQKDEILFQQSKLASMGEMIGNIAHQWRQPLSTISTISSGLLIQKELNVLKDEEFEKGLNTINKHVSYLSQTIDDFRDFSKPNKQKTVFTTKELFQKTLNLTSSQLTAKNINIIQNIENIRMTSFETELIQALINVINNARDALVNKEQEQKVIFINVNSYNNSLVITILDNAGGIDNTIINRVFEPYFTTKHQSQGTGIGLYMTQEIVTKHLEGQISVKNHNFTYENNKYTGALFEIILPVKDFLE